MGVILLTLHTEVVSIPWARTVIRKQIYGGGIHWQYVHVTRANCILSSI